MQKKTLWRTIKRLWYTDFRRKKEMANVFDVASYILEKSGRLSTMKLQKLCYYSQAWALVWNDKPLFENKIYAWANGPVCRDLFNETKGIFSVVENDEPGSSSNLSKLEKDTIDVVLDFYGKHDAQWLSRLTHMEDPWKETKRNEEITMESMAMYYGGL